MWRYHNCNPKKREVNDCVIRAISFAEDRSWDDVYSELSIIAQEECIVLDDVMFVEPYLNNKYDTVCFKCNGTRMTVKEFVDNNPTGTFLITMQGHITCLKDGYIYDTWDCTSKRIWSAWKVK